MGDLFFALRMIIITVVVLFLLQIKVGPLTLEERSMNWVRTSTITSELQTVAHGLSLALTNFFRNSTALFPKQIQDRAGERFRKFIPERAVEKGGNARDAIAESVSDVMDEVEETAEDALD